MSTEAQPASSLSRRSSLFHRLQRKQKVISSDSKAEPRPHHGHSRSSSFAGFVSRILPSQRPEKGHTRRSQSSDDEVRTAANPVAGTSSLAPGASVPKITVTPVQVHDQGAPKRTKSWGPQTSPYHNIYSPDSQKLAFSGIRASNSGLETTSEQQINGLKRHSCGSQDVTKSNGFNFYRDGSRKERPSQIPFLGTEGGVAPKSGDADTSRAQQLFEAKRARRKTRKSLQQSGDFLGVQGANPRTGYWDISTGTSSSEPSQMSDETKKLLEKQRIDVEERKQKFEEAQSKHQYELARAQTRSESRRKEHAEQKVKEQQMKQRKYGRWKLSENGWSSVAEPELSPIEQSLAGSPTRETSPSDRLFPMPSAADPTPYVDASNIGPKDYFGHRQTSSPLTRERGSSPAGSPPPINHQLSIPRKPIGTPSRQRNDKSSDTVIHSSSLGILPQYSSHSPINRLKSLVVEKELPEITGAQNARSSKTVSTTPGFPSQQDPFLDQTLHWSEEVGQALKEVTVTSYQSVSKHPVKPLQTLPPNQKDISLRKHIISLKDFPQVSLKDPMLAGIPSAPRVIPAWAPSTIIPTQPDKEISSMNIPTTTIIGYAPLQNLPAQSDGQEETPTNGARAAQPLLDHMLNQISSRTDFYPNRGLSPKQKVESQTDPADTATLSEHQLGSVKQQASKLCQMDSLGERADMVKSTPISISTSPRSPQRETGAARLAALTAFQNLRHQKAIRKAQALGHSKNTLTSPKLRRDKSIREIKRESQIVPGEFAGIGDLSRERWEVEGNPELYQMRLQVAAKAGGAQEGKEDSLVIWHPSPNAGFHKDERTQVCTLHTNFTGTHKPGKVKASGTEQNGGPKHSIVKSTIRGSVSRSLWNHSRRGKEKAPRPAPGQITIRRTIRGGSEITLTAWQFVKPVFEADSGVRKRWAYQHFEWWDLILVGVAAGFVVAMFVVAAICFRVVAFSGKTVWSFMSFFYFVMGL